MQSTFGKNLRITIDGGSHEESIGVTIEGFKEVPSIDMEALQRFMDRRAPGRSPYATRRREPDIPELVSRDPLRFIIRNQYSLLFVHRQPSLFWQGTCRVAGSFPKDPKYQSAYRSVLFYLL